MWNNRTEFASGRCLLLRYSARQKCSDHCRTRIKQILILLGMEKGHVGKLEDKTMARNRKTESYGKGSARDVNLIHTKSGNPNCQIHQREQSKRSEHIFHV
jgi:hypothetical protein